MAEVDLDRRSGHHGLAHDRSPGPNLFGDFLERRPDQADAHPGQPQVAEPDPVLPIAMGDHRRCPEGLGPVRPVPPDAAIEVDDDIGVVDVVGGRCPNPAAVPGGIDLDPLLIDGDDRESDVERLDPITVLIAHDEGRSGPVGIAATRTERAAAADADPPVLDDPLHAGPGAGRKADPLTPLDDAGQELPVVGAERPCEQVEDRQVVPQRPGGAGAVGGHRLQLPTDLEDRGFEPADVLGGGELHDRCRLEGCHQVGIEVTGAVRPLRLGGDGREQTVDRSGWSGGKEDRRHDPKP